MLAAARAVEARLRRKPVILLDEIASELDEEGREKTIEALALSGWQVIAAAAELPPGEWPGKIWKADDGAVLPVL
jgi:DNA replication and repair protein RecF